MSEAASIPTHRMTADEFFAWADRTPLDGKFELHNGYVVPKHRDPSTRAMAPERVRHADTKLEITLVLREAVRKAGLPCRAHIDGIGIRIDPETVYEPDAFVRCGEPLDGDAVEVNDPVIVVEVLSPATGAKDLGEKLRDYFSLDTVQHYLVVDPKGRRLMHYSRQQEAETYLTRILATGTLRLSPPGIAFRVEDVFAGLPADERPDEG